MTYVTNGCLGIDVTTSQSPTSTQEFPLGQRVFGNDGTEWVYVKMTTANTQYDTLGIDENYNAAPITTAMAGDGWTVGFAQVAFTVNYFGWVATRGSNINFRVKSSCAADTALYTSATAGILDDDSSSVYTNIDGVVAVAANNSATASYVEVLATFPRSTTF